MFEIKLCSRHSRAAPTQLTHTTHSFIQSLIKGKKKLLIQTPIQYTDAVRGGGLGHWPKVQLFRGKRGKEGMSETRTNAVSRYTADRDGGREGQ